MSSSRLNSIFRRSIEAKMEDSDNYILTFYSEDYSEFININASMWPSQAVWLNMSNVSILPLIDVFSLYKAIPMSVVYLLIFVTGMFGNACTCVVIARNKHMHTATNFYLFSLAMSDLLLLILGLPQEIYQEWNKTSIIFGESFCVLRGMAAETSTNASVLTITAFTVERYLAICHPLRAHTMSKLSRAIKLIWGIWLTSALFAIPTAIQFGVVEQFYRGGETTLQCLVKNELEHTFEVSTFLFFCLPMAIISGLYMLIAFRLRRSSLRHTSGNQKTENSSPESRVCRSPGNCRAQNGGTGSRRAVIKMLAYSS